jgi:hypothetical protein
METWKHGNMETWKYGNMEIWTGGREGPSPPAWAAVGEGVTLPAPVPLFVLAEDEGREEGGKMKAAVRKEGRRRKER